MKIQLLIAITVLLTFVSSVNAQTITGNVKFQYSRIDYSWTYVKMEKLNAECDSLGNFELENINHLDTLEIIPIPISLAVKIYNFPASSDSIHLSEIPLFRVLDNDYALIHFRTRRASKKYFRKIEKERELEKEEFLKMIAAYRFIWNDKEYELEAVESGESFTIFIDLGR